jgi:hypothetical protein
VEATLLKALPFGLVLFLGTYLGMRRRRSGRAKSSEQLPPYAESLGLQRQAPRRAGEVGILSGWYQGYEVRIDPDELASISVRFARSPAVALRTFQFCKRAPQGMTTMFTPYRTFEQYFVERYASPEVARRIASLGDLDEAVERLSSIGQPPRTLAISADGIECRLKIQGIPYIAVETLQHLLPELIAWARAIEPAQEDAARNAGH